MVYGAGGNTLSQLAVGGDGTLTLLPPAAIAGSPLSFAVDSTGTYAVSIDGFADTLELLTVESDGTLTAVEGGTVASGLFPSHGAFDPTGAFFYAASSNQVDVYAVSATGLTHLPALTVDTGDATPLYVVTAAP